MKPYGSSSLKPLYITDPLERRELEKEAKKLPYITINSQTTSNVVMLGAGYFNPLIGFMNKEDALNVAEKMSLRNQLFWPIPILNQIRKLKRLSGRIALLDLYTKKIIAIQEVEEVEKFGKDEVFYILEKVFKTTDIAHPGIRNFIDNGNIIISGPVKVLNFSYFETDFPETFQTAYSIRNKINEIGWQRVVAFQTRNPMHRAHEELCKIAKESLQADGILIHMVLGKLKKGDLPADIREKCIKILAQNYFTPNTVLVAGYGYDMFYAGPREALLHAIIRQNCGASHLIIGRDHAGVGTYYGPLDAQNIFTEIPAKTLDINIFKVDNIGWSKKLNRIIEIKNALDHKEEDFLILSGTKMREMLSSRIMPPEEIVRPEVAKILMDYYESQYELQ